MQENLLPNIIKELKQKTLAQFQLKYTGIYLFGEPIDDDYSAISYKTDVISPNDLKKLLVQTQTVTPKHLASNKWDTSDNNNRFLYEIKKKPSNAFAQWITLGRAVNNDIVLRFPTVSKLHARLEIETTSFGDPIGYQIVDNNSTGKTIHNGIPLEPNKPTPIEIGDNILLGNIHCIVLDATQIWRTLR